MGGCLKAEGFANGQLVWIVADVPYTLEFEDGECFGTTEARSGIHSGRILRYTGGTEIVGLRYRPSSSSSGSSGGGDRGRVVTSSVTIVTPTLYGPRGAGGGPSEPTQVLAATARSHTGSLAQAYPQGSLRVRCELSGYGVAPAAVLPTVLDFGSVGAGYRVTRSLVVHNASAVDWEAACHASPAADAATDCFPGSLDGSDQAIVVTPALLRVPAGCDATFSVTLCTAVDHTGPVRADLRVSCPATLPQLRAIGSVPLVAEAAPLTLELLCSKAAKTAASAGAGSDSDAAPQARDEHVVQSSAAAARQQQHGDGHNVHQTVSLGAIDVGAATKINLTLRNRGSVTVAPNWWVAPAGARWDPVTAASKAAASPRLHRRSLVRTPPPPAGADAEADAEAELPPAFVYSTPQRPGGAAETASTYTTPARSSVTADTGGGAAQALPAGGWHVSQAWGGARVAWRRVQGQLQPGQLTDNMLTLVATSAHGLGEPASVLLAVGADGYEDPLLCLRVSFVAEPAVDGNRMRRPSPRGLVLGSVADTPEPTTDPTQTPVSLSGVTTTVFEAAAWSAAEAATLSPSRPRVATR